MADITLDSRTISVPRARTAAYDGARVASGATNAAPGGQATASNALGATTTVTPTIAADVLLAAQQAREPDRPRAFEARAAYDRAPRRQQEDLDPRDPVADLSNPDDAAQLATNTVEAQAEPVAEPVASPLGDNVVRLFATSTGPSSSADTSAPRERADFTRANQAYVGAGAADGLTFARAGVDTSLRPDRSEFDILI